MIGVVVAGSLELHHFVKLLAVVVGAGCRCEHWAYRQDSA